MSDVTAGCEHLAMAAAVEPPPVRTNGCESCLAIPQVWVQLRQCLVCGRVGCCDNSIGKHATAHFHATGHQTIRTLQPSETWRWCYADEVATES